MVAVDFSVFQIVRDAYLSRYQEGSRTDIFAMSRAHVVARELGLDADQAKELVRQIRLNYGPDPATYGIKPII